MRVLFQTIGVLVQYNWALPCFMTKLREDLKTLLITDAFSYLMGGFYYYFKQPMRMIPIIAGSGVFSALDKTLEDILFRKLPDKYLIHLNKGGESKLTDRILKINAPKIFTFHGSLDLPHVRDMVPTCKSLREVNKSVDAFVAVSDHSAKTIEENCDFKPLVIHNGVDTSLFNSLRISKWKARKLLSLPWNGKVILWSGRVDPDKGLHLLVKALPHVVKNCENVIVIVKGRTVNRAYLKLIKILSTKLGVNKYLKFTLKWTPNINMLYYYYYRASDVYVHTS
ncbi:glycosyltransferase family 4 protein, partial [Candidatus Bathyarchaeota archaeon]|nr:glycosyltransferase family 4 protein [Candidatus Bathyarchaeota archaeon]